MLSTLNCQVFTVSDSTCYLLLWISSHYVLSWTGLLIWLHPISFQFETCKQTQALRPQALRPTSFKRRHCERRHCDQHHHWSQCLRASNKLFFFGHRPKCFSHSGQNDQKYRLMNTVTASLLEKWPKCFTVKKAGTKPNWSWAW